MTGGETLETRAATWYAALDERRRCKPPLAANGNLPRSSCGDPVAQPTFATQIPLRSRQRPASDQLSLSRSCSIPENTQTAYPVYHADLRLLSGKSNGTEISFSPRVRSSEQEYYCAPESLVLLPSGERNEKS